MLPLASSMSYRKTTTFLNRVRHESEGGTPLRTTADRVEKEGASMRQVMDQWASGILKEHQFTDEGVPTTEPQNYGLAASEASLPRANIAHAVEAYNRDKKKRSKFHLKRQMLFMKIRTKRSMFRLTMWALKNKRPAAVLPKKSRKNRVSMLTIRLPMSRKINKPTF